MLEHFFEVNVGKVCRGMCTYRQTTCVWPPTACYVSPVYVTHVAHMADAD